MNFKDIEKLTVDGETSKPDHKTEYEKLLEENKKLKIECSRLRRINDMYHGAIRMIELITGREINV